MAVAAAALTVGSLLLMICEAVTAFGWSNPGYSYVTDYISDLGNPQCGAYDGRQGVAAPLVAGAVPTPAEALPRWWNPGRRDTGLQGQFLEYLEWVRSWGENEIRPVVQRLVRQAGGPTDWTTGATSSAL